MDPFIFYGAGQEEAIGLDLGCRLGRHSVYMASKGFDVTAVDLSDYGVNNLKVWAEKESLQIDTAVCNMLKLPFADNSIAMRCLDTYVTMHGRRFGRLGSSA